MVLGLWCSAHHLLHPKAFVVKIVKTVMAFPVLGTNRSKIVLNFKYILTIWHYSEDWRENLVNFCTTYFFLPQNQGSKYNHWIKSFELPKVHFMHGKMFNIIFYHSKTMLKFRQSWNDLFKLMFLSENKQMNLTLLLTYYDTSCWLVFVHFLEEIEDTKKTFRN